VQAIFIYLGNLLSTYRGYFFDFMVALCASVGGIIIAYFLLEKKVIELAHRRRVKDAFECLLRDFQSEILLNLMRSKKLVFFL